MHSASRGGDPLVARPSEDVYRRLKLVHDVVASLVFAVQLVGLHAERQVDVVPFAVARKRALKRSASGSDPRGRNGTLRS